MKILVAEPLAPESIDLLRGAAEVHEHIGMSREELLSEIASYEAIIVRSQTQLDAPALEAGKHLRVVGRAGIGLDNVDVDAATRLGIVVVNAPESTVISAAEHTIGLMLALARHIPQAHSSLLQGRWDRERFTGIEMQGKTLGILGLGKIGSLVAQRALAFGMQVIAYDPYIPKTRGAQIGVEIAASLSDLLKRSDVISVNLPRTPETIGILSVSEFAAMKPGALLVNASRGEIVSEDALINALKNGQLQGAAVDVFDEEPVTDHPLFQLDNVVVTPHLGASTSEAQLKAGTAVAEQVLLALRGEFAPYAVNVAAGSDLPDSLRPFVGLSETLGRILCGLAGAGVASIEFKFHGQIAELDARALVLAGLKGVFSGIVHQPVTFVNAPLLAKERGVEIRETKSSVAKDYVNLVSLTATTDEETVTVAGTLVGRRDRERIVRVYKYDMDMELARYMAFFRYVDRPGVIGKVGTLLGESGVNIASMQVGRQTIGGEALMGLTIDSPMPADALRALVDEVGMRDAHFIDLGR